ncbi:uncharacterized protein LOC142234576 isoform X3 [Haematobia irritans]|uniref:uncharacterized protein LOC142234576 isoform X3 n=1 Tax=Haematobia irritans TaxID=7368 RepID=UPI003F508BAF
MPLLPTIKEEETQTCFQQLWHCRYQLELMIPASLVFFAGGLKLAWTIFEAPPPYFDYEYNSNLLTAALFIGGLLGCITASAFVGRITKNIAHVASGSLLILGGILFIAVPNMFFALIFSCIFEGAALTISQVQAFSVGPEMANKDLRGFVMSMERCCLWFGILTQLTFTHVWYAYESPISGQRSIHSEQVHGLVVACLGFVSIVVALKQRTESPLLLLRQQRELAASAALKRLVDTQLTTTEVMRLREDCLQLLSIDADQSGWFVFRKLNARPLLKLVRL